MNTKRVFVWSLIIALGGFLFGVGYYGDLGSGTDDSTFVGSGSLEQLDIIEVEPEVVILK